MGVPTGVAFAMIVTVVGGAICSIACWLGLRWADTAGLPMPLLMSIEARRPIRAPVRIATLVAVAGGAVFGLAAIGMLRGFGLENMPGSLAARLSSTLFAAISLEVVLHLAIMSGLVAWTRSRWAGILGAAFFFRAVSRWRCNWPACTDPDCRDRVQWGERCILWLVVCPLRVRVLDSCPCDSPCVGLRYWVNACSGLATYHASLKVQQLAGRVRALCMPVANVADTTTWLRPASLASYSIPSALAYIWSGVMR
jgi:hypothetical protein